jgi:hypothetical protein
MAKKTKEELKKSIDETIEDVDKKIAMLEDIEDSVDAKDSIEKSKYDELETKYNELTTKYQDLQTKYHDRFFSSNVVPEVQKSEPENDGLQEVNYIDIKEI